MRVMSVADFVRSVEDRKKALGITDAMIEQARNSGQRRTPEKRATLRHIQKRARKAGLNSIPANF
jgi:hypothetical protein